jgi:16S rRNA (guanine1516-N2)-methyltransferase
MIAYDQRAMTSAAARDPTAVASARYSPKVPVAVLVTELPAEASTSALARELELPLVQLTDSLKFRYLLVPSSRGLRLCDNRNPRTRALFVDASWLAAQGGGISHRQPLARAVGRRARNIVDVTAGFGDDALLLAAMGYRVTAIERCPIVGALLRDGIRRARADSKLAGLLDQRFTLVIGEARELLPGLEPTPDTIYMDPMFPPKRKRSALARKSVRVLRELVGDDEDAPQLLQLCLQQAKQRVVVKRPHYAAPLMATPSLSYCGKLVRYDVYRTGG